MHHEPKISTIEAFLLLGYVGVTDLIGVALLLFGLDDVFILDILTFPVTQLYFRMKGVPKAGLDLMMNLGELVPYIGALPLRTIGVALVIRADRNPESMIAQTTEKISRVRPATLSRPIQGTTAGGIAVKRPATSNRAVEAGEQFKQQQTAA